MALFRFGHQQCNLKEVNKLRVVGEKVNGLLTWFWCRNIINSSQLRGMFFIKNLSINSVGFFNHYSLSYFEYLLPSLKKKKLQWSNIFNYNALLNLQRSRNPVSWAVNIWRLLSNQWIGNCSTQTWLLVR